MARSAAVLAVTLALAACPPSLAAQYRTAPKVPPPASDRAAEGRSPERTAPTLPRAPAAFPDSAACRPSLSRHLLIGLGVVAAAGLVIGS